MITMFLRGVLILFLFFFVKIIFNKICQLYTDFSSIYIIGLPHNCINLKCIATHFICTPN